MSYTRITLPAGTRLHTSDGDTFTARRGEFAIGDDDTIFEAFCGQYLPCEGMTAYSKNGTMITFGAVMGA